MSRILIVNENNKIEQKDIKLKEFYLKDFLNKILGTGYKALNKCINNIECILFYSNTYDFKEPNKKYTLGKIVITKLDLLNGYIDNRGDYECYYGFNESEILEIKKYKILSRKCPHETFDTYNKKALIYIDENLNLRNIHINKNKEDIKELIINILGESYYTIPFNINKIQCSIWFNNNEKYSINKLGFKFLEMGYIKGSIIISRYCEDYDYIMGEGLYSLDDGFTKEERREIIKFLNSV